MATEVPVFDISGHKAETLELDDARWGGAANLRILNQVVRMYRSNARAGTASTKKRGEVSGGGKKPWKQKHTGRARAGSIRSPLWRHGGIVFGPQPRNFGYSLPKTLRRVALVESIKGKLRDDEFVFVTELRATEFKTKPFSKLAETFKVGGPSVIVLEDFEEMIVRSLRNLADFKLCRADDLNAFDVINANKVLITKLAFQRVEHRVNGGSIDTAPSAAPSTTAEPKTAKAPARSTKTTARKPKAAAAKKPAAKATPTKKTAAKRRR